MHSIDINRKVVPWLFLASMLLCAYNCIGISIEQNSIRLVGGDLELEGRVEVFRGNQWGTVCDDHWDDSDASVVCRQLGYSSFEAEGLSEAEFGAGTGPIYFDDVACTGGEEKLANCPRAMNCRHDEDASVRCSEDTYFILGTRKLRNNSLVTQNEIQQSNLSLICFTENTACCSKEDPHVAWIAPDGSLNSTIVTNQSLVLNTTGLAFGMHQCIIPARDNKIDLLFIGILNDTGGLIIQELRYNNSAGAIYCISTGGPVTRTVWRKNGEELLKVDLNYQFSQYLVDSALSTFSNSIRFVDKDISDSGNYTCEVANENGTTSSSLTISTCKQDSTRLIWNSEEQPVFQVCFTDEWYEIEVYNGVAYRKTNNSKLVLQLNPSYNSIDLLIYNARASADLIVKCSTMYPMKHEHSILLQSALTDEPLAFTINGLMNQTQYECCVAEISNSDLTSIPSISSKCGSVTTLLTLSTSIPQLKNTANNISSTILGSLLGAVTIVALTILLTILCRRITGNCKYVYRMKHGPIEHTNPLYESSGPYGTQNAQSGQSPRENLNVYADIYPKDKDVGVAGITSSQYENVFRDNELTSSTESTTCSSANNPLYATMDTKPLKISP